MPYLTGEKSHLLLLYHLSDFRDIGGTLHALDKHEDKEKYWKLQAREENLKNMKPEQGENSDQNNGIFFSAVMSYFHQIRNDVIFTKFT